MNDMAAITSPEKSKTDLRIHYGPIYGRAFGETMALCRPTGFMNTIMSNDFRSVDCKECRALRLTIPRSYAQAERAEGRK